MSENENSDIQLTDEDKIGLVAALLIIVGSFLCPLSLGFALAGLFAAAVALGICAILMLYAHFLEERTKDLKRLIRATEKVQDQQEKFLALLNDKITHELNDQPDTVGKGVRKRRGQSAT